MSAWQPELAAIVGARHGGQVAGVLRQLQALDARFPNVAEITFQVAWTFDILGRPADALPGYAFISPPAWRVGAPGAPGGPSAPPATPAVASRAPQDPS